MVAWPRAPLGSVSIQVWGMACSSFLRTNSNGVLAVWGLLVARRSGTAAAGNTEKEPVKVGADGGAGEKQAASADGTQKSNTS